MSDRPVNTVDRETTGTATAPGAAAVARLLQFEAILNEWADVDHVSQTSQAIDGLELARTPLQETGHMIGLLFVDEMLDMVRQLSASTDTQRNANLDWLQAASTRIRAELPTLPIGSRLADLLPLMSILNDGRALRGIELMSSGCLDLLDVPPDDWRAASVSRSDDQEPWLYFCERVTASRRDTQRALLSWFATPRSQESASSDRQDALLALHGSLASMLADTRTSAEVRAWNDLVVVALHVLDSLIDERKREGFALRRLFAHLERCLANIIGSDAHPPPLTLLQNLLWYVVEPGGERLVRQDVVFRYDAELHHRLRLDRIATSDCEIRFQAHPKPGHFVRIRRKQRAFDEPVARGDGAINGNDALLLEVFDEEVRYLLDRMHELLEADTSFEQAPRIEEALAHLHTLKGSARMTARHSIAEYAHSLEGLVQELPADRQLARLRVGRQQLNTLFLSDLATRQTLKTHDDDMAERDFFGTPLSEDASSRDHDALLKDTINIGAGLATMANAIERISDVARDLEATALRWHRLLEEESRAESTMEREMLADLDTAREHLLVELKGAARQQRACSRSSAHVQQQLIQSRRVPAKHFRERLQRVLDDAAETASPRLPLSLDGGDTLIDRDLQKRLTPMLEHLIRNAAIHGIESMAERASLDKPPLGAVTLTVQTDGSELIIGVADDGRGVNLDTINQERLKHGEPALTSHDELHDALCMPGFTTLSGPSPLAGRGLGLSAVRQLVEQLGGRLSLWTQPGQGTRVTLTVPQPLVVQSSLLVRAGQRLYALPAARIRYVEPEQNRAEPVAARSHQAGERVVDLERLLGVNQAWVPSRAVGRTRPAGEYPAKGRMAIRRLHVRVRDADVILEVPEVLGHHELIAQSLGQQLACLKRFAGGSVLADGRQVLMLDLDNLPLSEAADSPSATTPVAASAPRLAHRNPTALVVDDSLTMRVAAARYLEERGVRVCTARDGVEALAAFDEQTPSILMLDIDMPRVDGFELLSRLQLRLGGRLPPTIVISSRNRAQDRRRALSLGAGRFLVKPWDHAALGEALVSMGVRLPDITVA